MTIAVELRLTNYQIDKATARLAHQRFAIRQLEFHTDPRVVEIATEALASMEKRLAALLVSHASLLKKQKPSLPDFSFIRRSPGANASPLRQ